MTTEHHVSSTPDAPASDTRRTHDVFAVLAGRTATRRFTGERIDDATLDRLVTAMLAAPSASNKQAWAFVAVLAVMVLLAVLAAVGCGGVSKDGEGFRNRARLSGPVPVGGGGR